jgi:hypothetical protein
MVERRSYRASIRHYTPEPVRHSPPQPRPATSVRFLLSLTDPIGAPGPVLNAALSSGGEIVDQLEAKRAAQSAEYRAMLQQAVDSGEAPPLCATRPLGDASAGCASEAAAGGISGEGEDAARPPRAMNDEFVRTRGLDASRGWISGPGGNAP